MKHVSFTFFVILLCCSRAACADAAVIHVDAGHVVNHVTPWMTGSCIEDVNHEIYGGLYDQKIFGESFEEPPPGGTFAGWTAYGGEWSADGLGVTVRADSGAKLARDEAAFADGAVEADVRLSDAKGENAGLLVRVGAPGVGADNFDGYEVSLSVRDQRLILGKHRHDFHLLKSVPAAISPGQWHHLRVTMQGPRLSVFLDGSPDPILDYTDTDNPLPAGRIALRTWNADASFRNVREQPGPVMTDDPLRSASSDAVSGQWDAVKTGTAVADFLCDTRRPFNGAVCQKIMHGTGAGIVGVANRGLNRWGIAVRKGQTFQGRLYLRGEHLRGPVSVALQNADGSITYAAQRLTGIGPDWAKYPFTLTAAATDPKARFAVWIDKPGTMWVDQVTLMGTGTEQFHGLPVRADIAQAIVAEGVSFLRYGGTMVNAPGYRWKKMIGDRDRRPPYQGHWYPYSTNGFGIFDFLDFCEAAHIEAAFAINAEETPQDAADLADYLTGPVTTTWGRRRAADGHPRPYHVRYIEVGNEENIPGTDPAGFLHYAERFRVLAQAIHGRDPHLALVCAAWWTPESPEMKTVFDAVNGQATAWDLHVWSDGLDAGMSTDHQLSQMASLFRQWDPQTTLKCVIFEENGGRHDQQRALGHALTLNASRRHGDFVLADCPANCLQPWQQNDNGWDQGQVFFTPDHVWAMPPYFSQQMAAENFEPLRVLSDVSGSAYLDVMATRSEDGKTLVLSVVNTSSTALTASISLAGFVSIRPTAHVWTLAAGLSAVNPPDGPETVRPQESAWKTPHPAFVYTFPAHSYTVLRCLQKGR
jgi:alpha-L-arabinofuranosidase